jgi:hypothetical protein
MTDTTHNASDLARIRPFPLLGITISGIEKFIHDIGGREKAIGKTTDDICREFIVPLTLERKCSYCDLIQSDPCVREASVFISHAWRYQFLDVFDAIESRYRPQKDKVFLWFDLFSNNQHNNEPPPFEWWCETFQSAIRKIGSVVMVLEPWIDPIPLTRAWCLWEIFCSNVQNSYFEVILPPKELKKMLDEIEDNAN